MIIKKSFSDAYKKVVECVDPQAKNAGKIKDFGFSNTMKAYTGMLNEDVAQCDIMACIERTEKAATEKKHKDFLAIVKDYATKNGFITPEQKSEVEKISAIYKSGGFSKSDVQPGDKTAVSQKGASTKPPEFKTY